MRDMETPPPLSPPPPAPPVRSDSNDKLFIILSHLSLLLGVGLLLPLIVYLVKNNESPNVAAHAKEALNFHITLFIFAIAGFVLAFIVIGFFVLMATGLFGLICSIIAAVKASEGGFYRYPLCIRLIN
jgi:hypothetical protein